MSPFLTRFSVPPISLLALTCLAALTGCEGSNLGQTLQQTLEPDPQLAASTPATASEPAASSNNDPAPEPGQADYVGPLAQSPQSGTSETDAEPTGTSTDTPNRSLSQPYQDLNEAPEELRTYLRDLTALKLLTLREPTADPTASTPQTRPIRNNTFNPNQTATRREFARWLFEANNTFYEDAQDKKIRAGVGSTAPVFKDVTPSDPDFGAIQGLAEAGIIPSALTGTATAVNFRPDAPLTRSDLILWKVPLDTHTTLPAATVEAVQAAWGFQDAAKIPALSLQAVLADYQLGEFANLRRALGYTTLFQPERGVTRAEAASVLWRFGTTTAGTTAANLLAGETNADETAETTP
ncbi:MAG: S-layer homology domain-containing protein [Cyanobacteria bacterium P01_A01_bin.105]